MKKEISFETILASKVKKKLQKASKASLPLKLALIKLQVYCLLLYQKEFSMVFLLNSLSIFSKHLFFMIPLGDKIH